MDETYIALKYNLPGYITHDVLDRLDNEFLLEYGYIFPSTLFPGLFEWYGSIIYTNKFDRTELINNLVDWDQKQYG